MRVVGSLLLVLAVLSCTGQKEKPEGGSAGRGRKAASPPLAILRAGEFPLWFLLDENGASHLTDIGGAVNAAALVPWPYARHVPALLAEAGGLSMAVNRYGFIRLAAEERGLALHAIPAERFAPAYTVGAFLRPGPGESPMALLYRDDWFAEPELPPPSPRFWSFDPEAGLPLPRDFPAFAAFPAAEGWNVEGLFPKEDAWYFRVSRGSGRQGPLLLRSESPAREGRQVSPGEFRDARMPESPEAAGGTLAGLLRELAAESGAGTAEVVFADFGPTRHFDLGGTGRRLAVFFLGDSLLALARDGGALYLRDRLPALRFALPALPENFAYSGVALLAGTVFAYWEEQADFNIGAAGFMLIRPSVPGIGGS